MLRFLRRPRPEAGTPAPTPRVAPDTRIYAIGDIHGQAHCLDILLERIDADQQTYTDGRNSRIVLLGDYVDRGADSRAALERVKALVADGAVALRGNHEEALLNFIDEPLAGARWFGFGGKQTVASYGITPPQRMDKDSLTTLASELSQAMGDHIAFLRSSLVPYHESGDVVFVHADLAPGVPLAEQDPHILTWGHPDQPCAAWMEGKLVVHGHYPDVDPMESEGRMCIDTGAFYTNKLTCLRLDEGTGFLNSVGGSPRIGPVPPSSAREDTEPA